MRDPLGNVSVRWKLPLGFLAVCLVSFGLGGWILTRSIESALLEQIDPDTLPRPEPWPELGAYLAGLRREMAA